MTTKALAVIKEALRSAAYTEDFAPDYAASNAPAVLSRVLAAMGGEPVAWRWIEGTWGNGTNWRVGFKGMPQNAEPLYAHPSTPIDLAAVRAVAEGLHLEADHGCVVRPERARKLADRLLRAINEKPNGN